MHITPYGVYALVDAEGRVMAINSDAFLPSTDGWTKIDEGYDYRYHHAQGNYLDGPLYDERGICRYKLADGQVALRTQAEIDADYVPPEYGATLAERVGALEGAVVELALEGEEVEKCWNTTTNRT